MVRNILPDDTEMQDELRDQLHRRQLVPRLAFLRNYKDISQAQVADELGCGQSRISKLENGYDADVTVGDLLGYAKVAHCNLGIVFESTDITLVDQIKHYARCISSCFDQMNDLAKDDAGIKSGVAKFHIEALINLVNIVGNASKNLRHPTCHIEPTVSLQLMDNSVECNRDPSHFDMLGFISEPKVNDRQEISLA